MFNEAKTITLDSTNVSKVMAHRSLVVGTRTKSFFFFRCNLIHFQFYTINSTQYVSVPLGLEAALGFVGFLLIEPIPQNINFKPEFYNGVEDLPNI